MVPQRCWCYRGPLLYFHYHHQIGIIRKHAQLKLLISTTTIIITIIITIHHGTPARIGNRPTAECSDHGSQCGLSGDKIFFQATRARTYYRKQHHSLTHTLSHTIGICVVVCFGGGTRRRWICVVGLQLELPSSRERMEVARASFTEE